MSLRKEQIKNLVLEIKETSLIVSSDHTTYCMVDSPASGAIKADVGEILENLKTLKRLCAEDKVKLKGYNKCKKFLESNRAEYEKSYEEYTSIYSKLRDTWSHIIEANDEKYYEVATELRYKLERAVYRNMVMSQIVSKKFSVEARIHDIKDHRNDDRRQLISMGI